MMQKLGDIATYINGYAFKPADRGLKGLPIIRIQDLTGNSYDLGFYDGIYPKKIEINNGDILISWSGSLGIFLWNGGKALLNQHIFKVVFDKKDIDKHYFLFAVKEKLNEMSLKTHGATMKHIIKSDFENITISLPDLNEQKRISNMLLKIENLIKMRKNQIQHYDTLTKSLFIEMFGDPKTNPKEWRKIPLSQIISKANNGMARRGNDENGSIVLRLVELQEGIIDYSKPNRILLTEKEKEKYLLQENDFLFARVNGNPLNVGRCAVFHSIGEAVYHNDHIIRVHFDDSMVNGVFASTILNSEYGKDEMRNKIKTSAGQYTISQDGIGAIKTIVPPIDLQNQFADFVAQVDKHKSVVQKSLDETQLLFDSLMQKYFG